MKGAKGIGSRNTRINTKGAKGAWTMKLMKRGEVFVLLPSSSPVYFVVKYAGVLMTCQVVNI